MSDVFIKGGNRKALAIELLGAALALDLDPSVVRTTSKGFRVPAEIAQAAGYDGPDEIDAPEPASEPAQEPAPAPAPEPASEKVERPKDTDNKDAWVEFAKHHGATDETLTGDNGKIITKDAIIASYGDKE